jgi:dipeptidyl-peptidase-4
LLIDNDSLNNILPTEKKFFMVQKDTYGLPAYYLLPPNFDSTKIYPLIVYCYGGPGGEEVANEWPKNRDLWLYYMATQGYIIACTDNRGVGNIDNKSNTSIYGKLGIYEVEDQADMVTLMTQKFKIDTTKTSIFGWSYGGYLAAKCLIERPDVFKKAIAVAPVTDWKYYDAAYTERYMGLPIWNIKGYENASLIHNTYKMEGKLLLIHGTADDNVHFQNSLAFIQELQKLQKNFEIMIYSDKNHGISGTFTRYHLFKTIGDFILYK